MSLMKYLTNIDLDSFLARFDLRFVIWPIRLLILSETPFVSENFHSSTTTLKIHRKTVASHTILKKIPKKVLRSTYFFMTLTSSASSSLAYSTNPSRYFPSPCVISLHSLMDINFLIEMMYGFFQISWIFIGPKRNQLDLEDEK